MTRWPLADTVWEEVTAQGKRVHFAAAPLAELDAVARATGIANITVGVPMHRAVARVLPILTPILPALLSDCRIGQKPYQLSPTIRAFGPPPETLTGERLLPVWKQGKLYLDIAQSAPRPVQPTDTGTNKSST